MSRLKHIGVGPSGVLLGGLLGGVGMLIALAIVIALLVRVLFLLYRARERISVTSSIALWQDRDQRSVAPQAQMNMKWPNYPDSRNAGIAPGLTIRPHWPGVRDPGRSTK